MGAVIVDFQAVARQRLVRSKIQVVIFHREIQATHCLMSIVAEDGSLPAEKVASVTVMSPVTALKNSVPQWLSSVRYVPEMATHSRLLACFLSDLCSSVSP